MCRVRAGLLAGVSAIAIAAVNPDIAFSADVSRPAGIEAKAPPATFQDRWSWWIQGAASGLAGDPGVAGLTGFDVDPQQWGWEAGIGFEYRPAMTPWIWSAQFRFGQNGKNSASSNPLATFVGPGTTVSITGTNSADRKEYHWAADFMVGRELGLGQGTHTARFGVRVAEIRGKTTGVASWNNVPVSAIASCAGTPSYCGSEVRKYTQTNQFLGVGPRGQLDGDVPLGGIWSFDYMVGIAGLIGRRKVNQDISISHPTVPTFTGPAVLVAGARPIAASSSSNAIILNVDAMIGISAAITQNASLLVSYQFDGYWGALKGYDSNGNLTNLDRFYHGPMVRLTITN